MLRSVSLVNFFGKSEVNPSQKVVSYEIQKKCISGTCPCSRLSRESFDRRLFG